MTTFHRDVWTVFVREITPVLRQPMTLLFNMVQPLLFLFVFGSLLAGTGGPGGAPGGGSPWQWFVPGILVMMCLSGPLLAGWTMLTELIGGAMERMLVSPLNRTAILVGRTLKEFAVLLAQAVLIIVMAVPLGFDLRPAGVLAGLLVLVLFGVGLGALSYVLAIASHPGGDLFWAVTQFLMFPLLLLSGVLLPLDAGPGWLRAAATLNPVYYLVEAERALFDARFADPAVPPGLLAAAAVAAIGLILGNRAIRRAI
ncbi:transport permease protein [Sphaerisporangium rufum]|uniref:Transport permease protein n=1 Tax=Sphaerisporangium rufum TaxID=1381558 RepID=A0A919R812_9ACTN|nr:ABC transporter permease [Sphaerisporangium rufum]GII80116.1 transport permease protein [Sphaerisporangium rufum]